VEIVVHCTTQHLPQRNFVAFNGDSPESSRKVSKVPLDP